MVAGVQEGSGRGSVGSVVATIAGGGAFVGLLIVARGMTELRWAHLYRQQADEGISFFQVGLQLCFGGGLATVSAIGLALVASRFDRLPRRLILLTAGLIVPALGLCAAIAIWVESHGSRCIGPC